MSSYCSRSDQQRLDPRHSTSDFGRSMVPSGSRLRASGSGPVTITHEVHYTHKVTITNDDGSSSSSSGISRSHRPTIPIEYPSVYPPRGSSRPPPMLEEPSGRSRAPQLLPPHVEAPYSRSGYSRFVDPGRLDSNHR